MRVDMAVLDFVQTYLRCNFLDMAMPLITGLGNILVRTAEEKWHGRFQMSYRRR